MRSMQTFYWEVHLLHSEMIIILTAATTTADRSFAIEGEDEK